MWAELTLFCEVNIYGYYSRITTNYGNYGNHGKSSHNQLISPQNKDLQLSRACDPIIYWFFRFRHVLHLRYKMHFLDLRWGRQILILESFLYFTYLQSARGWPDVESCRSGAAQAESSDRSSWSFVWGAAYLGCCLGACQLSSLTWSEERTVSDHSSA